MVFLNLGTDSEDAREVEDSSSDIGFGESAVDYEAFVQLSDKIVEDVLEKTITVVDDDLSEDESFSSCRSSPRPGNREQLHIPAATRKIEARKQTLLEQADQYGLSVTPTNVIPQPEFPGQSDDLEPLKTIDDRDSLSNHLMVKSETDSSAGSSFSSGLPFSSQLVDGGIAKIVELNSKRSLFGRLDAVSGSVDTTDTVNSRSSVSKQIDQKEEEDRASPLEEGELAEPDDSHQFYRSISTDPTVSSPKRTSFLEGKTMGHRRMKSAPAPRTPKKKINVKANIEEVGIPGSPFEELKSSTSQEARIRSFSHGDYFDTAKGQEELTKIAEKICQVDRNDLEMDDPEEIQVRIC